MGLEELEYHTGIDQLALDYEENIKILIDDFFSFKEWCSKKSNVETTVILSVLFITSIFQEARSMKIDFKSTKSIVKGILYRGRSLANPPAIRNIFVKPEQYFYQRLQHFLDMSIIHNS